MNPPRQPYSDSAEDKYHQPSVFLLLHHVRATSMWWSYSGEIAVRVQHIIGDWWSLVKYDLNCTKSLDSRLQNTSVLNEANLLEILCKNCTAACPPKGTGGLEMQFDSNFEMHQEFGPRTRDLSNKGPCSQRHHSSTNFSLHSVLF